MQKILTLILVSYVVIGQNIRTGSCIFIRTESAIIIRVIQQNFEVPMAKQPVVEGPYWQLIDKPPWLQPYRDTLRGSVPSQLPKSIRLNYVFDGQTQPIEFLLVEEANLNSEICYRKPILIQIDQTASQTTITISVKKQRRILASQQIVPKKLNETKTDTQTETNELFVDDYAIGSAVNREMQILQVECGEEIQDLQKHANNITVNKMYIQQFSKEASQIQSKAVELVLQAEKEKQIISNLMSDQDKKEKVLAGLKFIGNVTQKLKNITEEKRKTENRIEALLKSAKDEYHLDPEKQKQKKQLDGRIKQILQSIMDNKVKRLQNISQVIEILREGSTNEESLKNLKNHQIAYALFYNVQKLKLKRLIEQRVNRVIQQIKQKIESLNNQYKQCIKNPKAQEFKRRDPSCEPSQFKRKVASGILTFLGTDYVRISNLKIRIGECTTKKCRRGPLEKFDRVIYETYAVGDHIWANKISCVL